MYRRTSNLKVYRQEKSKSGERNYVTAKLSRKFNFLKLLYMRFGLQGMKNTEAFFLSFFCGDYSNIAKFRTEIPTTFTVISGILAIS
jgi:hypothetical protein